MTQEVAKMTADSNQATQDGTAKSSPMGSTNDLAADTPASRMDRILQWVPRILASKPHVIGLMGLGVYLILVPLFGVVVSAQAELIGGNYTNVTSDIAASIAAGGTLHLVNQGRKRRRVEDERLRLARETHQLLHEVYGDVARQLRRGADSDGPGAEGQTGSGGQDRPEPGAER
jgi:hypothetical protein